MVQAPLSQIYNDSSSSFILAKSFQWKYYTVELDG